MKTAIILVAAGVLSASVVHAQSMQPYGQVKPGAAVLPPEVNSQKMYQGAGPLTPTGQMTAPAAGKIANGQSQIGGGAPSLPANLQNPMAASEVSADIFALMQQLQQVAQQQRAAARESRDAAREAQVSAIQDAAEKMKQAAAATMQQAQINAAMQITGGAMQIGAGQTNMKPNVQAQTQLKPGQAGAQPAAPQKTLTPQEKQQAIGSIANAQQAFAASMAGAEADKKKAEIAAMAAAQSGQNQQAQQMMQQMQDMIRDVQAKLQAIQQSQAATTQQIMRN